MNQSLTQTKTLSFSMPATYLLAALFILGNIILPQICHFIPQGGLIFLPIYFFTLIGTLLYGWRVGLITAILSPIINNLLFAMPPAPMLPVIEVKSVILAIVAGVAIARFAKINFPLIAAIVVIAQLFGALFEWTWTQSIFAAIQDFRIGYPGIILQIVGAAAILPLVAYIKKNR